MYMARPYMLIVMLLCVIDLDWLGGLSEGPARDPIPNSTVKTLSADGTAS